MKKIPTEKVAKKVVKKSVSTAKALAPSGVEKEALITLPTGAKRQVGVAGSHSSKFPARYELISTIGLRRVAVVCGQVLLSEPPVGDWLNQALIYIDRYRAGDLTDDPLAYAAWCLMTLMHSREPVATGVQPLAFPVAYVPLKTKRRGAGSLVQMSPARYDLIPTGGLRRLAETYGEGSLKYTDNNWLNGMEDKGLINHAMAHLTEFRTGDQSEDHLAHALWNLMTTMHFEKTRPDLMTLHVDLPKGMHR